MPLASSPVRVRPSLLSESLRFRRCLRPPPRRVIGVPRIAVKGADCVLHLGSLSGWGVGLTVTLRSACFTPPCSWAHGGLEFTCSGDPALCQRPAFEALLGQEAGGQFWTLRWGLRAQRCPAVLWSREEGPTHGEVTQGCVVRKVAEGKALMADPRNERPAAECPASPVSMGLYPRYPADSVIPCHSLEWRRRYARCLALGPSHSLERVLGAEVLLSGAPLLRPHDTSCFLVWVSCRFH